MNIPSLSRRRNEPAPTHDVNGDGRIDGRDQAAGTAESGKRTPTGRVAPVDDETRRTPVITEPARKRAVDLDRDRTVERPVDREVNDADGRGGREPVPPVTDADGTPDGSPVRVVAGPKPRASLLASIGLIVGVAGALFVLTGTLAGYGIALGAFGAMLAVLGLLATRRRHIAGKTDALLGIGFGLAAVVLGVLAMTGQFDWPTPDGDWVQRFREWLDSQFADRL